MTPREQIIDFVRTHRGINLDGNKELWRRIDFTAAGEFLYTCGETSGGETSRELIAPERVYALVREKFSGSQPFSAEPVQSDEQLLAYIERFAYT